MPRKRKASDIESGERRQRKVMVLTDKVELLDMLGRSESLAAVARHYGINESTVRSIKKSEEKIRASVSASAPRSAKVSFVSRRDPIIEKMEKLLNIWIEDQTAMEVALSGPMIRERARHLYEHISQTEGGNQGTFAGSKGWYDNFKKRFSRHNVKVVEESSTSVDAKPPPLSPFPDTLKNLIKEKGYKPEQVFNCGETFLFWKKMPIRTFISKSERIMPGFKVSKDRLSLLMSFNASGDCMVKPMLVYRSVNPRALKGKNKNHLPVYWKSNKKVKVTSQLFLDWFNNCFVHEVERYLRSKNLAFKVLLILENAPGHPPNIQLAHPNVEVLFLPANTTSIYQPLSQGVTTTFKTYYTRCTFRRIWDAEENCTYPSVSECWEAYNIADCLTNIKESLDEIKPSTLNACWVKLWKEAVKDFTVFPNVHEEVSEIVKLSHDVGGEGFEDMEEADIEELLRSHSDELSEEDITQLNTLTESDDEEGEEVVASPQFTSESVWYGLKLGNELADHFFEVDHFMERSLKFKRDLQAVMAPYREIYKELQKKSVAQSTVAIPFIKVESSVSPTFSGSP